MSRTDLVADVFTVMRNAIMAKKDIVDVPASNTVRFILEILKTTGYIENLKFIEDKKQGVVRIYLKYTAGKSAIKSIHKVSKSSRRVYVKQDKVPVVLRGRGLAIISTSKGLLTDQQAREQKIGGEIIAEIY